MALRVVQQPDGRFALFDTAIGNYLYLNCTEEEIKEALIETETERIEREIEAGFERLMKQAKSSPNLWIVNKNLIQLHLDRNAIDDLEEDLRNIE